MKRIDNITATQGRLKQAYDKGLGKLVQNDISKTVNNIVKDTRINTGVITKFYPYLDKAEVKLSNDKLILCKILHRYGGELIDYYTPTGEEDYCIKLKEPCILPREELNCLIININDNTEEYLLLGFYEPNELIGISPATQGNMKLITRGGTNQFYIKFGYDGLKISSIDKPETIVGEIENESVKLEYVNKEEVYTKKEIDNILNSGIHNIDFLANLDNIIQELINYGA
ncbi:hypothetical protein MBORA_16250 [Methanobrevibacter oralis]|uniref:Uncharacterized protein n=1 Tax=Methanobrevibacter oralis TaxID=66851 RepID=A0A162FKH8_METOA|nr:hypothetical protein [Methanobrevibacter oralis]KZX11380.1 hypothetical protein MBORA_16250 [Methanobrevibacter oralis]